MIYITGDTHASFERFRKDIFPEQDEMSKEDYVIVLGDFGGVWYNLGDEAHQKMEQRKLEDLDQKSFTTLFIPGNHENYARLMSDEFPEIEWHGGRVRQIRPSILMLMRGEMYEIDGAKFFTFGGARSHDIYHGILDGKDPEWKKKAEELDRQGKIFYRVRGLSWWPEELPSQDELRHGTDTLEKNLWKSDFVLTHCAPASLLPSLGPFQPDYLNRYLEEIRQKLDYKYWFFGHYHANRNITAKDLLLYEQIIRIR